MNFRTASRALPLAGRVVGWVRWYPALVEAKAGNGAHKQWSAKGQRKLIEKIGAPDRIRTCDLCLRRAALYPAELRVLALAMTRLSDERVLSLGEGGLQSGKCGKAFCFMVRAARYCWRPAVIAQAVCMAPGPGMALAGTLPRMIMPSTSSLVTSSVRAWPTT